MFLQFCCPWQWGKLGINVSNFPFSLTALGFHLGIAGLFHLCSQLTSLGFKLAGYLLNYILKASVLFFPAMRKGVKLKCCKMDNKSAEIYIFSGSYVQAFSRCSACSGCSWTCSPLCGTCSWSAWSRSTAGTACSQRSPQRGKSELFEFNLTMLRQHWLEVRITVKEPSWCRLHLVIEIFIFCRIRDRFLYLIQ